MPKIAAIQMISTPHVGDNCRIIEKLVISAVAQSATCVVLPENFACMAMHDNDIFKVAETWASGPVQDFLYELAQRLNIWIIAGSFPIKSENSEKVSSTCVVIDDMGAVQGRYDKLHLFDVGIPSLSSSMINNLEVLQNTDVETESYQESATIDSGKEVVVVDTPFGRMGIAICYDLRFPELFRLMQNKGAEIFVIPAAFTKNTGMAHWQLLLRARAVENLCYVVAANQGGCHKNKRQTYGHSMIINPWGKIEQELDEGVGIICHDIDLKSMRELRQKFPCLDHQRIDCEIL